MVCADERLDAALAEIERLGASVRRERERGDVLLDALRDVLGHMPGRAVKMRARVERAVERACAAEPDAAVFVIDGHGGGADPDDPRMYHFLQGRVDGYERDAERLSAARRVVAELEPYERCACRWCVAVREVAAARIAARKAE